MAASCLDVDLAHQHPVETQLTPKSPWSEGPESHSNNGARPHPRVVPVFVVPNSYRCRGGDRGSGLGFSRGFGQTKWIQHTTLIPQNASFEWWDIPNPQ